MQIPTLRSGRARLGVALAAAAALTLGVVTPVDAGPPGRQTTDVVQVATGDVVGEASLARRHNGVKMNISTEVGGAMLDLPVGTPVGADWMVGDATTNWFVIFNNPDECATTPCGESDVLDNIELPGGGPVGLGIHYAAGHVAGSSQWHAAGTLHTGDDSGLLAGTVLMNPMGAEVHIIARSHGPMATITPGDRGVAVNSFDGGCDVNICGDAQAAIFVS